MTTVKPAPIRKTFTVNAPVTAAFDAFFDRMNEWSPSEHSLSGGRRRSLVIEPFAGGRWYETAENGTVCEWGRVVEWDRPRRALLLWQIGSNFTYNPEIRSEVEVSFSAISENQTSVVFEHRHLDQLGGDVFAGRAALDGEDGWGGSLKIYARMVNGGEQ
jgi:hypothetical protein